MDKDKEKQEISVIGRLFSIEALLILAAAIFIIVEGEATFVTGGTMVDGKTIAPDELRGRTIEGGETRQLAKGDVIIVPNGVPHWFKEISGPFLYYTVKVTDTTKPAGESTVSR